MRSMNEAKKLLPIDFMNYTLNETLEHTPDKIEKFIKDLAKDPYYAFDWAQEAMEAAAKLRVAKEVKHHLDSGVSVADLHKRVQSQVIQSARFVKQSTSPVSNLLARYLNAAWAEIAYSMEQGLSLSEEDK